jgi:serine/threonine protein kinase
MTSLLQVRTASHDDLDAHHPCRFFCTEVGERARTRNCRAWSHSTLPAAPINAPAHPIPPQAYKAAPGDGWKEVVSGESVSVATNQRNTLPFPTTCVRCEYQCHASPADVVKFLTNLESRHERDFFYKQGKKESSSLVSITFSASMKTLNPREELAVTVVQTRKEDEKGNWTVLEVPTGGFDPAVFMFPSFFIQNDRANGGSKVVALYRFELRKAWRDKSKDSEPEVLREVHRKFHDMIANAMCHNLMRIGTIVSAQIDSPAPPAPRTPTRTVPPPAAPKPSPGTPTKQPTPAPSQTQESGNGLGELIEGNRYRWKKGELIGHGAIGKVYMGLNFETGEMMAVKLVDLGQQLGAQAADELKAMEQEIKIFEMITHPNLVRYYGMEKTDVQVCIFLEFVSGGSIATMLRKFGAFSEKMIANFTGQIVDGLAYLHSQSICHRDIKAANILYSNDGVVKLADFGTAKKLSDVMNLTTGLKSLVGTPYMMAPEVIRQTGHGMPADVWSLACVIWEMATTKPPFTQYTDRIVAMYNIAHAKNPPEPPETLSSAAKDFVKRCMIIEAKGRATTAELSEHPFIANAAKTQAPPSPAPSIVAPSVGTAVSPAATVVPPEQQGRRPQPLTGRVEAYSDRTINSIAEGDDGEERGTPVAAERDRRAPQESQQQEWGRLGRARSGELDISSPPKGRERTRRTERERERPYSPTEPNARSVSPARRSDGEWAPSPALHHQTDFLAGGGARGAERSASPDDDSYDSPDRDHGRPSWGGVGGPHPHDSISDSSDDSDNGKLVAAGGGGRSDKVRRASGAARQAGAAVRGARDLELLSEVWTRVGRVTPSACRKSCLRLAADTHVF